MCRLNVITSIIKYIYYFSAPPNQILPPSNQVPTPSRPRSIPALSLGLLVVCLFSWEKACQRQRRTMVCGQLSRTALANPPPPSGASVGQISRNSAVLRLKDRPPPGIVACEPSRGTARGTPRVPPRCRRTSPSSTRRGPCASTAGTPMSSCRCAWPDRRSRGNRRSSWAPLPKGYLTVPEKVICLRERKATGHTFYPSG